MKRALWLLLALSLALCAGPAEAYRVLVTTGDKPGGSSPPDSRGYSGNLRSIRNTLDALGVQYDVMRSDALTTAQVKAGSVTFGGVTRTYDAVIVTNFTKTTAATTYVNGFLPDALSLAANRPTIPVLIVASYWAVNGFVQSASCSLGVVNSIGSPFSTFPGSGNGFTRSVYATGYAEPWKTHDGMFPMTIVPGTMSNGVYLRPLVQAAISNASGATGAGTCTDCDGMTRASADSSVLWRLSRTAANGDETGAPIFVCFPNLNGTSTASNFSSGLMAMAVAALDSATRMTGFNPDSNRWLTGSPAPKVIGSKPGWTPRRLAIALTHAGGHSSGAAESFDGESGGVFNPDSATFKASLDSLNSLGIPITAFYNADRDTVAAYPNELGWYKGVRLAKFSPALTRGMWTSQGGTLGGNSLMRPHDVWGRVRARSLYASDCTTDTLSLYCNLTRIKAYNDSLFAGRTVRTLYAPAWDWIPSNYTRAFLPTRDSLVTVAVLAGFNSLIVSPEATEQSPGASYNLQSAGGSVFATSATNPLGLFNNEQRVPAYRDFAKTQYAGTFNFPATRGRWGEAASQNLVGSASHWWSDEFLWGALSTAGPWYIADYPTYYHNFKTRLSVLEVPVSLLAGTTAASNKRYGWWHIKSTVNQVKAMNRLAGRTVAVWSYTDEL